MQTAAAAHAAAAQPGFQFPQPGGQPYPVQPGQSYEAAYQQGHPAHPPANFAPPHPHDAGMAGPYGGGQPPQAYDSDYGQWGPPQDPMNYDLGDYGVPAGGELRGPPGSHPAGHGYPAPPVGGPYAHDDAVDYEDDEAPRSGRRWLIAAALIGSIGVGGAIAYAYKSYLVPRGGDAPPIVRASKDAPKMLPDNPGGKRFANADSKLMGRLESEDGAASQTDANGVRRVSTVSVGRDGSLTPPEASAPPMRPTVSVPGLTIVDGFGRGLAPPPPASPPVAASADRLPTEPRTSAPQPPQPLVVAKTTPAAAPPLPRPAAAEPPAVPAPQTTRPAAPEKQAAPKSVAALPPAPVEAASGAVNGYVAVLASHKSRIEALTRFADLQQKYDVLKGKIPDVLEADLSARGLGTMYRLVVGPPGSREAASAFCGQIKSAGHSDCWVTGY